MGTQPQDTTSNRQDSQRQDSSRGTARSFTERVKRAASAVLGITFLIRGLRQRSLRGIAMALVGGWLLSRALGDRNWIEQARDPGTGLDERTRHQTWSADEPSVSRSIIINESASNLYKIWRDPDQFSQIMGHFADVTATSEDRLKWTVHGPSDRDVSWETRIVAEEPGDFIRWESESDAMVPNHGSVHFKETAGDRGTEVTLSVRFEPPGGTLGHEALKRLDMVPETLVGAALNRFKSLVESGEIPSLENNPSGRGKGDLI